MDYLYLPVTRGRCVLPNVLTGRAWRKHTNGGNIVEELGSSSASNPHHFLGTLHVGTLQGWTKDDT